MLNAAQLCVEALPRWRARDPPYIYTAALAGRKHALQSALPTFAP
jgi:hypothetical protein